MKAFSGDEMTTISSKWFVAESSIYIDDSSNVFMLQAKVRQAQHNSVETVSNALLYVIYVLYSSASGSSVANWG